MAKKPPLRNREQLTTEQPFDRTKHVYTNTQFVELVKDAIRFFNGTPVHRLPPPARFHGSGIYALYYTGTSPIYSRYSDLNRLAYDFPIYIGKAVPKGWRQARTKHEDGSTTPELYSRLREHARSIEAASGIEVNDFSCRFMIFEGDSSDMIGTLEAALIKWKKPLWNTHLDGFGNHTPGAGRFDQSKSDWDVIHPGRPWADKCRGRTPTRESLLAGIASFLTQVGQKGSQKPTK
jgi:hypothetical protein